MGENTAVEVCRWTKTAIRGGPFCYKRWYGVESHRCIQMTPNLNLCNFACPFCWRIHEGDRGRISRKWDEPEEIVEGIIRAQRRLLVGFKGNPVVDRMRFLEAMFPRHVAISLDGEPTMYPMLAELVKEIREHGMTAFLVTNGSISYRLKELLENVVPHNLYISLYGPSEEVFEKAARPSFKDAWRRVLESLSLLSDFEDRGSRTLIRLTMVKGLNMTDPDGYSREIVRSRPMFVELKGYTWVGESIKRLPPTAMPTLDELRTFASEISKITGYRIAEVDGKSRVVMLVRDEEAWERNLETTRRIKERMRELDVPWRAHYEGGADFKLIKEVPPPWPGGWI